MTTQTTNTKQTTRDHLNQLAERRNALILALEASPTVRADFDKTVNELCETIAQIAVFKTLLKLSDGAKDITQTGAEKCWQMYRDFITDMHIYRTRDTRATYSDAMDLFNLAFMQVWNYLQSTAPLSLNDVVEVKTLKNGAEKSYTLFQTACKSIREYIHGWSKSTTFKKLHYLIGYTDAGEQVTTSKRPTDDLNDIAPETITALFQRHGLTAQQQEIFTLLAKGETPQTIATLCNMPLRTVQDNIKKGKAKFTTAAAYAEYITAQNAEKIARAKAEKHPQDALYIDLYTRAQDRTQKARDAWRDAFHRYN